MNVTSRCTCLQTQMNFLEHCKHTDRETDATEAITVAAIRPRGGEINGEQFNLKFNLK